MPFCPCDGRQTGLLYLPARWRDTTHTPFFRLFPIHDHVLGLQFIQGGFDFSQPVVAARGLIRAAITQDGAEADAVEIHHARLDVIMREALVEPSRQAVFVGHISQIVVLAVGDMVNRRRNQRVELHIAARLICLLWSYNMRASSDALSVEWQYCHKMLK